MAGSRRVLVVGDSHAVDLIRYLKPLFEGSGWYFAGHGDVGKSTGWYANQTIIHDLVQQHRPTLLVIVLGTNDADTNATSYCQRATKVIVQGGGVPVIWIGAPTLPRSTSDDNAAARRNEMLGQCVPNFLDGRAMTYDITGRAGDGVHFTQSGYKTWAERIYYLVRNQGNTVHINWKLIVAAVSVAGFVGILWWTRRRR